MHLGQYIDNKFKLGSFIRKQFTNYRFLFVLKFEYAWCLLRWIYIKLLGYSACYEIN